MTVADPTPPQISGLTYLRKIGQGGYADVFLYQQAVPYRRVAVKVLRDTGLTDEVRTRFETEANTMAMLQGHPNIVSVFDVGTTGDHRPYITMQHYPGATLADGRRHPVADVLRIGVNIASAIETAHRAGLLHRDIKPHNILTDQWQAPALTDFGISAQLADADDDVGVSVPWSPPEILFGTAPPSLQSDVYSLAATLWHLLAGRSPFEIAGDNTDSALMTRIRDVEPAPTGRPDVPASLERLLQLAMAKDPAHRPQSAMDFARWLQAIEQELRLPPTRIDVAEPMPPDQPRADSRTQPVGREARAAPPAEATRVRTPHGVPSAPPPLTDSAAPVDAPPPATTGTGRGSSDAAPASGVPAPGVTGPGVTAPGVTAPGVTAPGVTAPGDLARQDAASPARAAFSGEPSRTDPRDGADRPLDAPPAGSPARVHPVQDPQSYPSPTAADLAAADDHGHDGRTSRRGAVRVVLAVLIFLVLLVVAFVVGAMAGRAGSTGTSIQAQPDNGTGSASANATTLPPSVMDAPGVVKVAFARTGNSVVVSWAYPNQLSSDSVRYRVNGMDKTTPDKTIPLESEGPVCIQIVPIRSDGRYASDGGWPSKECET